MPLTPNVPNESVFNGNATTTAANIAFTFPANHITVINDSAVTVYVDSKGGVATSASVPVLAGESLAIPSHNPSTRDGRTSISVLAASGTAAIRVIAYE